MIEAHLSHVGLFVTDMTRMVNFFTRVLGFVVTDADEAGQFTFLSRDAAEHHQLVLVAGRESSVTQTVNQVSFKLDSLEEVQAIYRRIADSEASELRPVTHGIAWCIYFRDPEGNRLEMFTDTEWYIPQPVRFAIDLTRPAGDLRRETGDYCRAQVGFRPIQEWREEFARKIATLHRSDAE
jgi:catechol 2,3-dioxygenase